MDNPINNIGQLCNYLTKRKSDLLYFTITSSRWINKLKCKNIFKNRLKGLPWWLSSRESTCQCRRHRFNPWSSEILHAVRQLSLYATTTEPKHHNNQSPCTLSPCPATRAHHSERPAHHN